jgi:hypothetical protein
VRTVLKESLEEIHKQEMSELRACENLAAELARDMETWMLSFVRGIVNQKTILQTNDEIMNDAQVGYIKEFEAQLVDLLPRRKLSFRMLEDGRLISCQETLTMIISNIPTYDLISVCYSDFCGKVGCYTKNKEAAAYKSLLEQKQKYLYGKVLPGSIAILGQFDSITGWQMDPRTLKIMKANPEIQFVDDQILKNYLQMPIKNVNFTVMTFQTLNDTYMSLYEQTLMELKDKGLITMKQGEKVLVTGEDIRGKETTLGFLKPETKYDSIVQELFAKRLQKVYCKKMVEGFPFPTNDMMEDIFKKSPL